MHDRRFFVETKTNRGSPILMQHIRSEIENFYSYTRGDTPLHTAVKLNDKKLVYLVIKNKLVKHLDVQNYYTRTPLDEAMIKKGFEDTDDKIILFLVLMGARSNVLKNDRYESSYSIDNPESYIGMYSFYFKKASDIKLEIDRVYSSVISNIFKKNVNYDFNVSDIITDMMVYNIEEYKKILQ